MGPGASSGTAMTAGEKLDSGAKLPPGDDAAREQMRFERAAAAKHSGRVEWRLVAEAEWGVGGWALVIALALGGVVPYWLAMLVNGVLVYSLYMPLHEATHNNIQGRTWKLRWLNDWVGRVSSIPIGFSFRAHQISHMRHHAFTNDPARDPDYWIAGSAWRIPRKLVKLSVGQLVVGVLGWREGFQDRLPAIEKSRLAVKDGEVNEEFVLQRRYAAVQLAVMVALSLAGFFPEVLFLYYLPSRIGIGIIMFLFAWFPHHPSKERGRYRDTRVVLFPGSGVLFRGHDRHVIHHMVPRVPHYRIPAVWGELRESLEERGVRVEGSGAGPGAPPVLMRAMD